MPLYFSNIEASPSDPVSQWGVEGIVSAIQWGTREHWGRVAAAITAEPFGDVAEDAVQAVDIASSDEDIRWEGADHLAAVLAQARAGEPGPARPA